MNHPANTNHNRRLVLVAALLMIGITITLFFLYQWILARSSLNEPVDFFATYNEGGIAEISPPRQVADFTLTNQHGVPFNLYDLHGKVVLLYFGYTHCPDVCPLTLLDFRRVYEGLSTEEKEQVAFVFISVDGERDSAEWIHQYFISRQVDSFMIGLTGTDADLRRLGVDYGLFFEKTTSANTQADYLVDHTANVFLIDAHSHLSRIVAFGTPATTLLEEVRAHLSGV